MSNSIQAIDRGTVHRICSGQVVLTLATAVKELVENSVDAGATSIDIRLKEYGSDLLEVVDNGCGVEESNYQGLTLKHHTSKLQDFSDLVNVETFGFRGEALSSLCALGSLTITTCHQDSLVGAKLEYNHNGKLVQQTPCARQKGTTVSLSQLFYTLPVRHKEFQRNIKKEFTKMVHVLNAYCIISVGLRITCTNQIGKGKKTVILSTNANDNMKDNITNLFGAKQVSSLLTFKQLKPKEEVCEEFGVKTKSDTFNIEGFVSKCEHGQGRSSSDRQFLFINKRPCDVAKISRIVNDVYHMYNRHQNPFVILAISLNKECVDVNVTPDKRQIFVQEEKLLLATIKSSLIQLFEPTTSVYQVNQTTLSFMTKSSKLGCEEAKLTASTSAEGCKTNKSKTISGALASMKRSFASAFARESEGQSAKPKVESQPKQRKLDGFFSMTSEQIVPSSPVLPPCRTDVDLEEDQCGRESQSTTTSCIGSSQEKEAVEIDIAKQEVKFSVIMETARDSIQKFDVEDEIVNKSCIIVNECVDREIETEICGETSEIMVKNALGDHNANDLNNCANRSMDDPTLSIARKLHNSSQNGDRYEDTRQRLGGQEIMKDVVIKVDHVVMDTDKQHNDSERTQQRIYNDEDCVNMAECKQSCSTMDSDDAIEDQEVPSVLKNEDVKMTIIQLDEPVDICRKTEDVSFSMDDIRKKYAACRKNTESKTELYRSFRAKIAPSDNKTAEDELQKEISKDMFKKMDILGQFNLGFIIVKLGNDLFIVDQHATDEKYNFEQLQKTTIIQNQKLIQPQNLELTVANESIVLDNLEIFRANGFEFEINEDAPSTQRVKLVSKPISKNWIFGKEDIDELIFMLSDSPGVMCRPSRVRQMFASRACRKSIMIGTALNQSQMSNVVCHMGEIEQPWNCPHGRPTMRHLINLDMIPKEGT